MMQQLRSRVAQCPSQGVLIAIPWIVSSCQCPRQEANPQSLQQHVTRVPHNWAANLAVQFRSYTAVGGLSHVQQLTHKHWGMSHQQQQQQHLHQRPQRQHAACQPSLESFKCSVMHQRQGLLQHRPHSQPGAALAHQHQHQQQQQQQQRSLHLAPPFLVEDYTPAAVTTYRLGRMPGKLNAAQAELADCRACPRNCGVDRLQDEQGMCKVGRNALVSTVAPHFAEEAPLQGTCGSGTVFFSMCNMRCVFCQNYDISQQQAGFELTGQQLADWMLKLQSHGCHNINFVTPEHVAPQVAEAIAAAVEQGLSIPIIYNTSSYDALSSLALMDGLVDIYLPDFKFWTSESARRYAKAKDYPEHAREAIKEMHRQVGDLVFSPDGLAKRGVLLRHLVMPGLLDEGKAILDWVVAELGRDTFVHIMEQYVPRYLVGQGEQRSREGWVTYEEIGQRTAEAEVAALREYARSIGLWRFEEMSAWESGELAG